MSTLSACIITLNEGSRIDECLDSLSFADEVIVLDSGSTDDTRARCEARGIRFYEEPFRGFGPQKNRCFELASGDWILSIDADERITPNLAREIREVVANPGEYAGFAFPRRNLVAGRPMPRGGPFHNWPDWALRLFRRGHGRCRDILVHEGMLVDGPTKRLRGVLEHLAYDSYDEMMAAMQRYSTLGALRTYRAGGRLLGWRASAAHAALRGVWTLLHKLILRGGVWSGGHGLAGSIAAASYAFLKYAKLGELVARARGGESLDPEIRRALGGALPPVGETPENGPRGAER